MDLRPHTLLRPCPEPTPAGNTAAAPHFRWHLVPSGACPQHKHDARQAGPIRYSRATTFRIGLVHRKKRLHRLPKIIGNEAKCHGAFSFFSPPWLLHRHSRLLTLGGFETASKNKFVFVKLDFPRTHEMPLRQVRQNERLAQKYRVEGFPTVILFDSKGRPYARTGYQSGGVTDYVVHLDQLDGKLRKRDELFALSERSEGKAGAVLLDRALMSLQEDGVLQDYDSEIDKVIELDPNNESGLKEKYETGRKFFRIVSLIQEQRFREAQSVISDFSLKAEAPKSTQQRLLYLKSVVLHGLGEESSEIQVLNEAIALDPNSPLSLHLRGIISEHQIDQNPEGQE